MRTWWIGIVMCAAACGKSGAGRSESGAGDCKAVKEAPASAVATLSQKYPNDPAKVAAILERCVAPTGTPCERIAAIATAIPDMVPKKSMPCETLPPEMQRCLLPSYGFAHPDDCAKVYADSSQKTSEVQDGPGP